MSLPEIPVLDYRAGGLPSYQRDGAERANRVMDAVVHGIGPAGRVGRAFLPLADRLADRRLTAMQDPYANEVREVRRWVGRAGPIAFSLSYEFGCTSRVFDGAPPVLFRTLDWPFRGIGGLVEIVHLPGEAGEWAMATWPGVVGCLQGTAPGRFTAALNQAPERVRGGRAISWLASKRRVMRGRGMPPTHLLRRVFETAPDFHAACKMLETTNVAAPVIFTIAGLHPGEARVIERTEVGSAVTDEPAAANHFASPLDRDQTWRARGIESHARRDAILGADEPPEHTALTAPVLNDLTRLAVTADTSGRLIVTGFEGDRQVTARTVADWPAHAA